MKIKEQLDAELELAQEMLGPIKEITLYKDKYAALCEAMGQSEIQIYKGTRVFSAEELSTDVFPESSGST